MTKPLPRIAGFLAAVLGALLAAVVLTPVATLLGADPRRTAHLSAKVAFLAFLYIFSRRCGIATADAVPLPDPRRGIGLWCSGFGIGAALLAAFSLALYALGARALDDGASAAEVVGAALKYVPLAFLIGLLEDLTYFGFTYMFFRGRGLAVAFFFAATHFLNVAKDHDFGAPTAFIGVEAVGAMLLDLQRIPEYWRDFAGLAIVGYVLVYMRRLTGALWLGMGIHGGWYWVRMVGRKIGESSVAPEQEWLYGTDKYYDGVLGWGALLLTGLTASLWLSRRGPSRL